MNPLTIYIENLSLSYGNENIFNNLNLSLPAGRWIGLLGQSGVGKSSLLRLLAGIQSSKEKITGRIYANNPIPVRQQIAYMAQTDLLLPWLNVLSNATLSVKLNHSSQSRAQIDKAKILLQEVGLGDAMHLFPHQLSGGMRQRVALVRTLVDEKPIVLMDEPFSAIDAITRFKLQKLATELLHDKTVLFITHDPIEALRLAHDIYIMQSTGLNLVASLSSSAPRDLTDPLVLKLQSLLFHELTEMRT